MKIVDSYYNNKLTLVQVQITAVPSRIGIDIRLDYLTGTAHSSAHRDLIPPLIKPLTTEVCARFDAG